MRRLLPWLLPLLVGGCTRVETAPPDVLLFDGRGASPGDVAAVAGILRDAGLRFETAGSAKLNRLSESKLKAYRLLVIPGGNFIEIGNGLTADTTRTLRNAVRNGLGYVGICAGAFFAGASPYNGLNLTEGVRFPFYALEDRGIRKAAVPVTTSGGQTLDVYWEDGPQLAGWGQPVAKYPDGTPAIVQGRFGEGWVVLAGVHAEAPENWRRGMDFKTPATVSRAYAATLVDAALHRRALPHE